MTDRELIVYGIFALWVIANWVVYWWTRDEWEFYDQKTGKPLAGWKVLFLASLGTIIAQVRAWWDERNGS